MSELHDRAKHVQRKLIEKAIEYEWPIMVKTINDRYFFAALYNLIQRSQRGIKSMPQMSEILNPFKLCRQDDLKIVIIDTVSTNYNLAKIGMSLVSKGKNQDVKGIDFSMLIRHFKGNRSQSFDKTYKGYQKQGILFLQLPFTRIRDVSNNAKNMREWRYVNHRLIRRLSETNNNLVFIFFTNEFGFFKDDIHPNNKVYYIKYEDRKKIGLIKFRYRRTKIKKMLIEIDEHIKKHFKTKIIW